MSLTNDSPEQPKSFFSDAAVISTYTRKQAIEDGVLVDVSKQAQELRFTVPVAITSAVWADCVEWTDEDSKRQTHQDQSGRLHDVLWMFWLRARVCKDAEIVMFQLLRVPRGGKARTPRMVELKSMIGPGDNGEPVITIMFPNED